MYRRRLRTLFHAVFLVVIAGMLVPAPSLRAATADEIQTQINEKNGKIADLEKEIAAYQAQLDQVSAQKQTLQSAVKTLDLSAKKLAVDIAVTNNHIDATNLQLKQLASDINTKGNQITGGVAALGESLRSMNQAEEEPLVIALLANNHLSDFLDNLATLQRFQSSINDEVDTLRTLKLSLEDKKTQTEKKKAELISYQHDLVNQKKGLDITRSEKNALLAETKNKESNYQALIAQKKAEESSFEAELIRLAASLGTADTKSAPTPSKGILSWPLNNVYITQYFGNTKFAQSGAYNGQGHNGVDFRASIGTPVKAVLTGTVEEINQGSVKYCQYGKWVLVRHNNGLSSLYAHLSSIAVVKGQVVTTGQVLGYSGDTGYATGPHLHLTIYVSSAVTFKQYKCNSGYTAYIPIAPLNAYLNPLSYL